MIVGYRRWRPHNPVTVWSPPALGHSLPTCAPAPGCTSGELCNRPFSWVSLPPEESTSSEKHFPSGQQSMHLPQYSMCSAGGVARSQGQCITSPNYGWNGSTPVHLGSHEAGAPAGAACTAHPWSSQSPSQNSAVIASLPTLFSQHTHTHTHT